MQRFPTIQLLPYCTWLSCAMIGALRAAISSGSQIVRCLWNECIHIYLHFCGTCRFPPDTAVPSLAPDSPLRGRRQRGPAVLRWAFRGREGRNHPRDASPSPSAQRPDHGPPAEGTGVATEQTAPPPSLEASGQRRVSRRRKTTAATNPFI